MPTKKDRNEKASAANLGTSSSVDELLLAALEGGGNTLETGRYIVTFKEGAAEDGIASFGASGRGMRVADARDFDEESVSFEALGDADAVTFPEIGVALVSAAAAEERSLTTAAEIESDSPVQVIEPEHFVFAEHLLDMAYAAQSQTGGVNLRSLARILEAVAKEMDGTGVGQQPQFETEEEAMVLGATWGLNACRVPPSSRSGAGIKVAILDTGLDLGHPDFAGRTIVSNQFVGQPVQDLNGHGTHCTGTACGTKTPPGTTPRYGIGFQTSIFVGKVLTNSGSGTQAGVLAGMNWAIANRCQVISMSLGAPVPVNAAYTAAGQAALNNGCLIIAAAGNVGGGFTGAPANSPTIVAVASLDPNLNPSVFSSQGKIEIAGPGRDVFSSFPRPTLYKVLSGTSMATPHVAGCAALLAQLSPSMRGLTLRNRLLALARPLPFPPTRVGRGLVQAIP